MKLMAINLSVCAALVTLLSVPAARGAPIQTFEVSVQNMRLSTKSKPQGGPITIEQRTTMPDGSKPPQLLEVIIDTPPGITPYLDAASKCVRQVLQNTGRCPSSSKIATGTGTARVDFGPFGELTAPIVGYRGATCAGGTVGCIYLWVAEPQTGVTTIIDIDIYRRGNHYQFAVANLELPSILGIEPAVTYVKITMSKSKRSTERVRLRGKIGKRRVKHYIIENPRRCPSKGFTVTAAYRYKDGSTNTASDTIVCR